MELFCPWKLNSQLIGWRKFLRHCLQSFPKNCRVGWKWSWLVLVGGWLGRSHLTGILSRKYPPLNSTKLATLVQKTTFYQPSYHGSHFGFDTWWSIMINAWHYEWDMIKKQYSSRTYILYGMRCFHTFSAKELIQQIIWKLNLGFQLFVIHPRKALFIRFWYSPSFDWVQMSPITAHIERPKGIARNLSTVKNTKQSKITHRKKELLFYIINL